MLMDLSTAILPTTRWLATAPAVVVMMPEAKKTFIKSTMLLGPTTWCEKVYFKNI